MFRSLYSVYCLCVNVSCTAATECQPNCSYIYIYIYHTLSYIISYEDGTECSETLEFKLQTPANHTEEAYDKFNNVCNKSMF
jgi:hypothetical protein